MRRLSIALMLGALAASAGFAAPPNRSPAKPVTEHHALDLHRSYSASGKTLKSGHYTVVIEGDHATLRRNNKDVLTDIKVETNTTAYRDTGIMSSGGSVSGTPSSLQEIDLGGTHTRLIFG